MQTPLSLSPIVSSNSKRKVWRACINCLKHGAKDTALAGHHASAAMKSTPLPRVPLNMGAHIYVQPTDAGTCVRYSAMQSPSGEVVTLYKHTQAT
jgi:hypothetical protein